MEPNATRKPLVDSDLCHRIVGAAFAVYNQLGYGFQEKVYQKALGSEFKKQGISFLREHPVKVMYGQEKVGDYRLDFLVHDRVIVELKVLPFFKNVHLPQVLGYLQALDKELAVLVYFTRGGVLFRRVVNPKFPH